jgi:aldehyde dehydrogenase (NAD+)
VGGQYGRSGSTFIAGHWVQGAGDGVINTVSPATEQGIGVTRHSSVEQVDAAVAAARKAFESDAWRAFKPQERSEAVHRLADLIEKNSEELARLVVDEVGSPITLARTLQVGGPIESLRWYAEAALRGPRGAYEVALPLYDRPVLSSSVLRYRPAGVVAALPAYNYPINLLAWKLGGALASGCTTVVLPSPQGVLTTLKIFELIAELDLPPGVVNLVVGGPEVGKALTSNPGVDMVSFTGSDSVGAQVMAQAAGHLSKSVLELGGKSADVILPGQDLAATVPASLLRFSRNAGQGCAAWTRILVQEDDVDGFVGAAKTFMSTLKVGNPHDEDTVVGPLISGTHRDRVEGWVSEALDGGATFAAGGGRPAIETGYYLNPALLVGVHPDDAICQRELFAPIAVLLPYKDVDDAVAIANNTVYGLAANVFGDLPSAIAVADRLRAGTVTINGGAGMRPDAPWGGYGRSGVGRELGEDGFAEFFEVQHVQWPLGAVSRPPGT